MFYIAEVDPPITAHDRALFCKSLSKNYDLECMARAQNVMEASQCRKVQVSA